MWDARIRNSIVVGVAAGVFTKRNRCDRMQKQLVNRFRANDLKVKEVDAQGEENNVNKESGWIPE